MDYLWTSFDDLQETSLTNVDFSWFTDCSYLKNENDQHCSGYAISNPFEVIEAAHFLLATLAQETKLHALIQAYILAKGKTTNIYTDNQYALRVAHNFGMLWKQGFLTSRGDKI